MAVRIIQNVAERKEQNTAEWYMLIVRKQTENQQG
jgi:hypothetical protein